MIVIDLSPLALNIMVIECSVPHLLLFVFNIVERNLITAEYVSSPQASLANQPPLTQKARGLARETRSAGVLEVFKNVLHTMKGMWVT